MKIKLLILLISLFITLLGCEKQTKNPCDGLMNESPPLKIGIFVFDNAKGDNLILTNALEASDIKVTEMQTGNTFNSWRIIKTPNSPLNGMLEIAVFNEKANDYSYKIELKGLGTILMGYTIKQEKTNDPCKIYNYPMNGLKSTSHNFELFKHEDKTLPNIIKIHLL